MEKHQNAMAAIQQEVQQQQQQEENATMTHRFDRHEMADHVSQLRMQHGESKDLVSIFSWNILANSMALTRHAQVLYADCAQETVKWSWRGPRILEALATCGADIIYLQEVEPHTFTGELEPLLQACGYQGAYETRNKITRGEVVENIPSCAIFYKHDLFEMAWLDTPYRGLMLGLRILQGRFTGSILAVANSHLEGHPERTDHRQAQIKSVWRRIDKHKPNFVIIGGDFNDGANSILCQHHMRSLTNAYDNSDARDGTCILGVNPFVHKDNTRVDHLFFDDRSMSLKSVQNVLDSAWDREAVLMAGLPGYVCPSDHLSIGAVFKFLAHTEMHQEKNSLPIEDDETSEVMLENSPLSVEQMEVWRRLQASQKDDANAIANLKGAAKGKEAKRLGLLRQQKKQEFMDGLATDSHREFISKLEQRLKKEAKNRGRNANVNSS